MLPVLAAEVWPIRHQVLRPELPLESSRYPGDERPGTRHFAVLNKGRPVGVGSVYHEDPPAEFMVPGLEPGLGWHLRGMATLDEVRGTGAGSALLRTALANAVLAGAGAVWCKAGTSAAGFYCKHGFQTLGDEFEIPGLGPHLFMYWVTSPTAGCRRLLFTRLAREGPVQPVGGYARRVRQLGRDASNAGIRRPLG